MANSVQEHRAELSRAILRDQRELARAVGELRLATQARLDLGRQVAEHPGLWLGGSFLLGWSLAVWTRPARELR